MVKWDITFMRTDRKWNAMIFKLTKQKNGYLLDPQSISLNFSLISSPNLRICADNGEEGISIPNFLKLYSTLTSVNFWITCLLKF